MAKKTWIWGAVYLILAVPAAFFAVEIFWDRPQRELRAERVAILAANNHKFRVDSAGHRTCLLAGISNSQHIWARFDDGIWQPERGNIVTVRLDGLGEYVIADFISEK